jgi:predicted Zn-dependent protease
MRYLLSGLAIAMIELGDVKQALELVYKVIGLEQGNDYGKELLIHCLVLLGRADEAREIGRAILAARPGLTISAVRAARFESPYRERHLSSLRAIGLPE